MNLNLYIQQKNNDLCKVKINVNISFYEHLIFANFIIKKVTLSPAYKISGGVQDKLFLVVSHLTSLE